MPKPKTAAELERDERREVRRRIKELEQECLEELFHATGGDQWLTNRGWINLLEIPDKVTDRHSIR